MTEKIESKKVSLFRQIKRAFPLCFKYEFPLYLFDNTSSILHGAAFAMDMFAKQWFFDSVANAVAGTGAIETAFLFLVVYGLIVITQQALNGLCNFSTTVWMEKFQRQMLQLLMRKLQKIDPVKFEDQKYLDGVNKAKEGTDNIGYFCFLIVGVFTFYLPYFAIITLFLYNAKPLLALSILLVFIPVVLSQFIRAKVFAGLEETLAQPRRQYEYFGKTISDREFFKETRLTGSYAFFKKLFSGALDAFSRKSSAAERKTALWELAMKILTLGGYVGILFLLIDALLKNEITVGAFAAVFAEIGMMFGIMEEVVVRHIGSLTKGLGAINNFLDCLDTPERAGEAVDLPKNPEIVLKNVRFRYPEAEKEAVCGVDLTLKSGETLAIVGENGAGKTTLVRLLTGLYLPTEGTATIAGHDMANIDMPSLFSRSSAVFQKYMRYRMTLRDNVRISDSNAENDISPSLEKADLHLPSESFPDGKNTMLSREFDGVDLSGGQWQRVAIARGFYRAHGLIVLDEPTAAIDPLEETRVYRKFAELAKESTAVIVTHRMGSARIADRILVMKDGVIEEEGSHDALMKKGGHYAQMVEAQSGWYE